MRTNGYLTMPIHSEQYIFVDYCKFKTNFIASKQLLYMGCPLTRESKQKKNSILIFQSVCVRLQESVHLRECVNTEFDCKVKWGFETVSVNRATHFRECPLAES